MKTRSGRYYRALRYAGTAAGAFAAQTAQRTISNLSQRLANRMSRTSQSGRSLNAPSVVSVQHDVTNRYRRKRMPRRKRKKWVGFCRKVSHSIMQLQPLQSYTVDYTGATKSWAVNVQTTDGQMIGAVASTGNDEILNIFKGAYGSALARTAMDKYKIFLKSMCLDLQITNVGSAGCVIDVHTLIARKDNSDTARVDVQYTNAFAEQNATSGGAVDGTNTATTPWQNPLFLSFWKILNKKQVLLGVGQSTTLQIRMPYNKYLSGKYIETCNVIGGFTRAILIQARGVPENNAGTPRLAAGSISWMAQLTAAFGVPPSSTTAAATNQA